MAQVQHYVPQVVLREFCDEQGHVHTWDKLDRRHFKSNPRNVAAESAFYDIEGADGHRLSLEVPLSRLEAEFAEILKRVLASEEIGFLSRQDRLIVSQFAAVQFVRVRGHRERFKDMSEKLLETLRSRAPDDADLDAIPLLAGDEEAKFSSIKMIIDAAKEFAPHFMTKAWALFEAPPGRPFWISDNPVTLYNSSPSPVPFMGNLGIGVQGIEIYMPISPTYSLGFLCPSIAAEALKGNTDALRLKHDLGYDSPIIDGVGYLADGLRYGYPIPAKATNMDLMNSLQVSGCERWIYSRTPDFELAERMLNEHPHLATGPRFRVG